MEIELAKTNDANKLQLWSQETQIKRYSSSSNFDFDSGFESILNLSDESPAKSPRLTYEQSRPLNFIIEQQQERGSVPSTPVKCCSITNTVRTPLKSPTHVMITPVKRPVADVNGIYYSCIKSPLKSPQNYFNTDTYIRERDTLSANLLRSPAFKTATTTTSTFTLPETPKKIIKCKQFVSSEQFYAKNVLTTPTEEEFLQLLFKNRHLASNPECLIGRCMGLEHCDILNELQKRSMNNIIDIVLNNLNASDYKNMFNVSQSWRDIIRQDKKRNKERIKYIRFKKKFIESAKVSEKKH